ncbi:MAG: tetratricopeptide repeat protein [Parasphingorhabdus sp.]
MIKLFKYVSLAALPLAAVAVPTNHVVAQNTKAGNSADLQNALRRIARNSNDSSALADAGLAALKLGDTRAAIGFLAKADQIYSNSGRVKAGLARALLTEENPFGALRYFDQAIKNGIPLRSIAADRGLAYDLIGRNADAQKDYELALRYGDNDQLRSRYAISLGISGNMIKADEVLNPLLQKSDRDAWRNRAFLLAMNDRKKDANGIARQTMQRRMANAVKPFFDRMPKLTAAQKAAAIHLGHFPASENIGVDVTSVRYAANSAVRGGDGADAGLIPLGEPLGSDIKKPRVLAMPDTSTRRRPGKSSNSSRRNSKKPVEIVVLDNDTLPTPSGRSKRGERRIAANSREGRRLLRQAAKDGSSEAQDYLERQKTKTVQVAKVEVSKPTSASANTIPAAKPVAAPTRLAAKRPAAPGFEALSKGDGRKNGSKTKIASLNATQPSLISSSIERKVVVGTVQPKQRKLTTTAASEAKQLKIVQKKPVQLVNFDLANAGTSVGAEPVQVRQADIERKPLADIMKTISIPDAEKKADIVPVDLESIEPAKKKPIVKAEPKLEPEKVEPKKELHPKRYWVQLATGSNVSALKYDFRRMKKKNTSLFSNMEGWTSPWGKTKRMVIGPFTDLSDAKKFDSAFRKNGGDSFAWVSAKGTKVNKLP